MIHFYYGFGKGKTSSAIGAGMRAYGNDMNVLLVQFFKDNKSGELNSVPFEIYPAPERMPFNVSVEEYKPWVNKAFNYIEDSNFDVVILDEFADLIPDYLSFNEAKKLLCNSDTEYIITGHNKNQDIISIADYVTHFIKEKHPYDFGTKARRGIEY